MPHRLFRTLLQTCALVVLWLGYANAQAQTTVNWMNWTAPGSYPSRFNNAPTQPGGAPYDYINGATGSLTLPDNTVVGVTLTGEVMQYSCFAAAITSCQTGWWRSQGGWGPNAAYAAGTFTSAKVPTVPNNANLITQAGYVPSVARHTLTFSQPVTNIVMTVASLGGTAGLSAYRFDEDFTLLSQDTKCSTAPVGTTPPINCLAVQGRTLTGREGSGTVQFTGTFTSISWEVTVPEVFSGFNIGVTSASFSSQSALTLAASLSHIPVTSGTSLLSTTGGLGTGAITYTVISGPCTVSGTTLTGNALGTCRINATKAGDATYASITSNTVTVTVVKPLSVTYEGNGQTYGVPPTDNGAYDANESVAVLAQNLMQRTGHTFNGWNTSANGSGTPYAAGGTFPISASTTLYARWLAATYPVTYDSNSATAGTAPAAQDKTHDVDLGLASNTGALARTGYTFAGWNTAANGAGTDYAEGATYSGNAAMTLYAKWAIATYAVTYAANSATAGTTPATQTKTHAVDLALATNTGTLARTGYTFAGWNTAANGSGTDHAPGATYSANTALTLYAKWTAVTYPVAFDSNGATSGTAPAAQSKVHGVDLALATNTGALGRTGYTFAGWNTAANGSGTDQAPGATYSANAALTLYAKWAIVTYAIAFDANGATAGTPPAAQTKTHGINLTLAMNSGALARLGYTFVGWNTAADGSGTAYLPGAIYAANAAGPLFAQWVVIAAPAAIPTLSEWSQFILALLLLGVAGWSLRRR